MSTIVATPEVDLTNCDREPIHQLGEIQPIGFLLVLTADWMISNASANTGEFLDLGDRSIIGRPATDILTRDAIHTLRNRLALLRGADAIERVFRMRLQENGQPFDVALHMLVELRSANFSPKRLKTQHRGSGRRARTPMRTL